MRHAHVKILSTVLVIISLSLLVAKVTRLGLPLTPNSESSVWVIEALVEFNGRNRAANVNLDIPDELGRYVRLDELFISRNYGLIVDNKTEDRRAEWSIRRAKGLQRLYYRLDLTKAPRALQKSAEEPVVLPDLPAVPDYGEPFGSAVADLLDKIRSESADIFTFVGRLLILLNQKSPDESVEVIRKGIDPQSEEWVKRIVHVLAGARIPARVVRGIVLEDGKVNTDLTPWLEIHNGERWEGFDPRSGSKGFPKNFVRWGIGDEPLLTVRGGRHVHLSFSIARQARPALEVSQDYHGAAKSPLMSWSLFELPINTQNVYRILLMVPLGALIVTLMRILIGVPTFGTFMPVLIALAFRETQLFWGVVLFCIIVGTGLTIRFYLERMQLLLVPRLSAVLTVVVLLMLLFSMLSSKLGFVMGFSVALFPIVIMTMVIERMSIVWSESGHVEAFKEGLGSLVVAILSYLAMTNDYLEHLIFVFPELILLLLALFILSGRYTGYRLTELFRFKDLAK